MRAEVVGLVCCVEISESVEDRRKRFLVFISISLPFHKTLFRLVECFDSKRASKQDVTG